MGSFTKAVKSKAKLRLCIMGTAGSGKTYSALQIAKGIGKKICVIDTEHGSASLYSNLLEYDTCVFEPPFHAEKLVKLIDEAEAEGYDVIIIDSVSHFWAGEGGMLERKDAIGEKTGNSFTAWGKVTPIYTKMVEAILQSKSHMIVTLRTKTEYVIEQNDKGKSTPKKVGLAPVARDGIEYEFTTVFDIDQSHNCCVSKDRSGLFDVNIPFVPGEKTGKLLLEWLNSGVETTDKAKNEDKPTLEHESAPKHTPKTEPKTATEAETKSKTESKNKPLTKPKTDFESMKARMIEIGNLPGVQNWWVKYAPMIALLTPEQQEELKAIGTSFREEFNKKRQDSMGDVETELAEIDTELEAEKKLGLKPKQQGDEPQDKILCFIEDKCGLISEFAAYTEKAFGCSPTTLKDNPKAFAEISSWVADYTSLLDSKKMTMQEVIDDIKDVMRERLQALLDEAQRGETR